jgi:hypothetical protein
MGFDVSYHPIAGAEMRQWYFDRLPEVQAGNSATAASIAREAGIDEFYIKRYLEVLGQAASLNDASKLFEDTHGFMVCVVQGLFRTYYYTRGSSLTGLIEEYPTFEWFASSITEALGFVPANPVRGRMPANYSSGVWLSPEKVVALLAAYENDPATKEKLDAYFSDGQIEVVLRALGDAKQRGLGLYEATEVIEPNPLDLNSSKSVSNLFNCDPQGALLYQKTALAQLKAAGVL